MSQAPIISPEELKIRIENKQTPALLDASFFLPGSDGNIYKGFESEHIPGAQIFDIDKICEPEAELAHTMPCDKIFAESLSKLGIKPDDEVVIYGQSGLVMGPARAWWMFKYFGHDNVKVLDGGLPAWKAIQGGITSGLPAASKPQNTSYICPETSCTALKSRSDVLAALNKSDSLIVDARPAERFCGLSPEPRPGMRAGHIPGSINLPAGNFINPATGRLKSDSELKEICAPVLTALDKGKTIISSCGSGITACVLALCIYKLTGKIICIYGGSWADWGRESAGTPIAVNT